MWPSRFGWRNAALLTMASLLASGCSTIDRFGGRAVTINGATQDSKSRSIMMNVMRAAYREPLQFSDVSTVAGTGQITGSLGINAPIKSSPVNGARNFALNPTVGATGTNQFNITNLNTQEFYFGLQSPVSMQQIANLIDAGYDPTLILFLTASELNVTTVGKDGKKLFVTIRNDTDNPDGIGASYYAFQQMVKMGFSEQATDGQPYGPAMTIAEAKNSRYVAAIQATAGSDLALKKNEDGTFQFYKKGGFATCFDVSKAPPLPSEALLLDTKDQKISDFYRAITDAERFSDERVLMLAVFDNKAVPGTQIPIPKESLCGYKPGPGAKPATDDNKPSFTLKMRSVEGIFQFLGAMARRQVAIAPGINRNELKVGPGFAFRVQEGQSEKSSVDVWLHDKAYFIERDPSGNNDQSTQVLQILTDLLALQSSAKNIPSPGLITVIGR